MTPPARPPLRHGTLAPTMLPLARAIARTAPPLAPARLVALLTADILMRTPTEGDARRTAHHYGLEVDGPGARRLFLAGATMRREPGARLLALLDDLTTLLAAGEEVTQP